MKPWFIIVIIGALSGIIVLRTAYSDFDSSNQKAEHTMPSGDNSNE